MWGDKIRTDSEGRGVPKVRRLEVHVYETGGSEYDDLYWDVTYPDLSFGDHFECCGKTHARGFDTWQEAITFAINRGWES